MPVLTAGMFAPPQRVGFDSNVGASPVASNTLPLCGLSVPPPVSERDDVSEVGDSGPSLCEDGAGVGLDLAEGDGAPSGSLEAEVEAADTGEEACVGEGWNSTSWMPVRVRLMSSESSGPLPPPGLPSRIRSSVGFWSIQLATLRAFFPYTISGPFVTCRQ